MTPTSRSRRGGSLTFTTSNWSTAQTVTLAAAEDTDNTAGTRPITVASSGLTSVTVTATEADNDGGTGGPRADNPYAGRRVYVNPEWSAKAAAEPGGSRVSNQPTGVWLDRIAAIATAARTAAWACATTSTRRSPRTPQRRQAAGTSSSSSTTCPAVTAPRSPPTASWARTSCRATRPSTSTRSRRSWPTRSTRSLRIVNDHRDRLAAEPGHQHLAASAGGTAMCDTMQGQRRATSRASATP